MSDSPPETPPEKPQRPTLLGIFDRPSEERITSIEIIAIALSAAWLLASAVFFIVVGGAAPREGGPMQVLMAILAVFMPVAMIWVAALAARASKVMRDESTRLQTAIDAMRHTYLANVQATNSKAGANPDMASKLDEIAEAQRRAETALATFSTSRSPAPVRRPRPPEATGREHQASLALGTPADDLTPPLDRADFIKALDFPENEKDEAGFAALRKALRDRQASQLIRAAQDTLTLLSHDGIYMDDLMPDRPRPDAWRLFATGERGPSIGAVGGIRDRSSLALTAGRMKTDAVFRDTSHHFLRRFDKMLVEFEETASDADIIALANTRTARAFMLLGRVTGIFE